MKKIKEYTVVFDCGLNSLSKSVNELIKQNWQPYGNMVAFDGGFCQPMVKYESEQNVIFDNTR